MTTQYSGGKIIVVGNKVVTSRDVTDPANTVRCGFHVQNPLDSDADLSHDQNYQLLAYYG